MPATPAKGGGGGNAGGIRAGAAYVELYLKDSRLIRGLDGIRKRIASSGMWLAGVGKKLSLGAGLAAAPLAFMFKGAIEQAGALDDLADAFSTTTESISPLAHAFQVAGLGLEDLELAMKEVAKRDKSGRPVEEVLAEWADGLNDIDDPAERARKAIEQFGKAGIKIAKVAPDLKELMQGAPIISSEDAKNAEKFDQGLTRALQAAKASLLPAIGLVTPFVTEFGRFVERNKEAVGVVAAVTVSVLALGGALTVVGLALSGIAGAAGLVGTVLGAILSPIGLVVAGVGAIGYVLATQTEVGRETTSSLKAGFIGTADTAKQAWGGIVAAIRKGDLELALQIAVAAMSLEWAKFELFLTRGWVAFKASFVDGWHEMVLDVKRVWNVLTTGLAIGLTYALDAVVWIFNQTIGRLVRGAADLLDAVDATETANELRSLGRIQNLGDQVRNDIMRQGEQDDQRMRDEFARAQAERNGFRVAQIGKAMGNVDEAQRIFAGLVGRGLQQGAKDESQGNRLAKAPEVAAAVRGAFQAPDWKGSLGIGDKVSDKVFKKQQEQLEAQRAILRALQVMPFARIK